MEYHAESFRICVEWLADEMGVLDAQVGFVADDVVLNRSYDCSARTVVGGSKVSALHLAEWFAENWWRLIHEPAADRRSTTDDWRMIHALASAGGGSAWPPMQVVGDGESTLLVVGRSTEPIRPAHYLWPSTCEIQTQSFVAAVDHFVETVLARAGETLPLQEDVSRLDELWRVVRSERTDPVQTSLRRSEALLGAMPETFEPQELAQLVSPLDWAGRAAIDEALALVSPQNMQAELSALGALPAAQGARLDCHALLDGASPVERQRSEPAWRLGERAAEGVRTLLGVGSDPLPNTMLDQLTEGSFSALVGAEPYSFVHDALVASATRSGGGASSSYNTLVSGRHPTGRRFKLASIVGDILLHAADDAWAPAARTSTYRQKAGRAFAQSLLLPEHALRAAIDGGGLSRATIERVSEQYEVSEMTVTSTLSNKGIADPADLDALGIPLF